MRNNHLLVKKRTLHLTSLIFILAVFLVTRLSNLPDVIKSFFPIVLIMLLPLEFGYFALSLLEVLFRRDLVRSKPLFFPTIYFLGVSLIFLICGVLNIFGIFSFLSLLTLSIVPFLFNIFHSKNGTIRLNKSHTYPIVIILIFSVIFFIFSKSHTPFPLQPIWDQFVYGFSSNRMIAFNEFHIFSDAFSENIYKIKYTFSIFHLLIAFSSYLAVVNVIFQFWTTTLVLSFIYGLIIYFFTYKITKRRSMSILSSFIAIWITETVHVNEITSFVAATFFMLIFPFLLLSVYDGSIRKSSFPVIFLIIFLAIFHLYELIPLVAFVLGYYILKRIFDKDRAGYLLILLLVLYSLFYILSHYTISIPIELFEISYTFPIRYKMSMIEKWYTIFFSLSLLSIIFAALKSIRGVNKDIEKEILTLSCLFLAISSIFFVNFSGSMRITPYLHPLIAVLSSYLIVTLFCWLKSKSGRVLPISILAVIIVLIVIKSTLPLGFLTSTYSLSDINRPDYSSSFYYGDVAASYFIKDIMKEDTFIISSPGQQVIVSGFTGAYSFGIYDREDIYPIKEIILGKDIVRSHSALCDLETGSESNLFVISGRSIAWAKARERVIPIYTPRSLSEEDRKIIQKFMNYEGFEYLYSYESSIYVFEIKNC